MSICIVGDRDELMPGFVGGYAERCGVDVIWMSESQLGASWSFEYTDGRTPEGSIRLADRRVGFAAITGAYVNLNPKPGAPGELEPGDPDYETFLVLRRASLRHLINSLPGTVANRPCAGRSNNSKAYQMRLLADAGFRVPQWIATNDAKSVDEFASAFDRRVVVKSISGLRSEVRALDVEMMSRLRAGTTPIIVQERVPGFDVRVHTVGKRTFATSIEADGVDYRFSDGPKVHKAIELAANLEVLCHRFAAREHMVIAGFDFRVTECGKWYCLEMNPVPTFLPYEFETGQPICRALLECLAGHELQ